MMYHPIDPATVRWCVLRTAGPSTLKLATSLAAAGLETWTPRRQQRRMIRGGRKGPEVEVAILPTFVFARADALPLLAAIAADPVSPHPDFSIFRHGGRVPLIADREIAGLQREEERAADQRQRERDAETADEARRIRAESMRTERAKRKAMRAERREFAPGTLVDVADMPALAGMSGEVVQSNGASALVLFGGALTMKIEAWRLSTADVCALPSRGLSR